MQGEGPNKPVEMDNADGQKSESISQSVPRFKRLRHSEKDADGLQRQECGLGPLDSMRSAHEMKVAPSNKGENTKEGQKGARPLRPCQSVPKQDPLCRSLGTELRPRKKKANTDEGKSDVSEAAPPRRHRAEVLDQTMSSAARLLRWRSSKAIAFNRYGVSRGEADLQQYQPAHAPQAEGSCSNQADADKDEIVWRSVGDKGCKAPCQTLTQRQHKSSHQNQIHSSKIEKSPSLMPHGMPAEVQSMHPSSYADGTLEAVPATSGAFIPEPQSPLDDQIPALTSDSLVYSTHHKQPATEPNMSAGFDLDPFGSAKYDNSGNNTAVTNTWDGTSCKPNVPMPEPSKGSLLVDGTRFPDGDFPYDRNAMTSSAHEGHLQHVSFAAFSSELPGSESMRETARCADVFTNTMEPANPSRHLQCVNGRDILPPTGANWEGVAPVQPFDGNNVYAHTMKSAFTDTRSSNHEQQPRRMPVFRALRNGKQTSKRHANSSTWNSTTAGNHHVLGAADSSTSLHGREHLPEEDKAQHQWSCGFHFTYRNDDPPGHQSVSFDACDIESGCELVNSRSDGPSTFTGPSLRYWPDNSRSQCVEVDTTSSGCPAAEFGGPLSFLEAQQALHAQSVGFLPTLAHGPQESDNEQAEHHPAQPPCPTSLPRSSFHLHTFGSRAQTCQSNCSVSRGADGLFRVENTGKGNDTAGRIKAKPINQFCDSHFTSLRSICRHSHHDLDYLHKLQGAAMTGGPTTGPVFGACGGQTHFDHCNNQWQLEDFPLACASGIATFNATQQQCADDFSKIDSNGFNQREMSRHPPALHLVPSGLLLPQPLLHASTSC